MTSSIYKAKKKGGKNQVLCIETYDYALYKELLSYLVLSLLKMTNSKF